MNNKKIKQALEWCEQFENNIVFNGNGDEKCTQALQMMNIIRYVLKEYIELNKLLKQYKWLSAIQSKKLKDLQKIPHNSLCETKTYEVKE